MWSWFKIVIVIELGVLIISLWSFQYDMNRHASQLWYLKYEVKNIYNKLGLLTNIVNLLKPKPKPRKGK